MIRELLSRTGNSPESVVAVGLALALLVGAAVGPGLAVSTSRSVDAPLSGVGTPQVDQPTSQVNQPTPREAAPLQANETTELPRKRLRRLIHEFVNRERVQRGLDPLALNETLSNISRYHSSDMVENDYFAHVSPDNETLADRYDRFGFDCRVALDGNRYATGAENIAYTYYEERVDVGNRTVVYSTPKQLARGIVTQWMNSPPHRKNVLRPYWQREGIGIAVEETPTGTRVYVTQNFC